MLRPRHLDQAHAQLTQLQAVGLRHVELAVPPDPSGWVVMARQLQALFPHVRLGAASVADARGLAAVAAAGLPYAVSPILDAELMARARAAAISFVPGVFTPTEVALASRWGATAVKLFPAVSLGPQYWRSLAGPLGPLPFCIAAGGLSVADVPGWLAAGVDAVALGSSLFVDRSPPGPASARSASAAATAPEAAAIGDLSPDLADLLTRLRARAIA